MPRVDESPELAQIQYQFARYIRDPEHSPCPPGIEPRRMQIYRDLFFRNVESFIESGFPVLRALTPDDRWQTMLRDYFSRHKATTPLAYRMGGEFLKYLESERHSPDDPPFLYELAHYEWLELSASLTPHEFDKLPVDQGGDPMSNIPVLNPSLQVARYRFPVHKICLDYQPASPPEKETILGVYRHPEDDKACFIELNSATFRLVELLRSGSDAHCQGEALLQKIAKEMKHPRPEVVIQGGRDLLNQMREKGVLLGVQASQP